MEHPYNLLKLVVKQQYNNRPEVLKKANRMTQDYGDGKISYEQALSNLYQLFSDLPPDIVLYFLSTVPLPENQEIKSTSILPGLMKQMLIPSYHNGMRPILLKYLNEQVPPLIPITCESKENENISQSFSSQSSEDNSENKENVVSVIDVNIKQDKDKNKKATKLKPKNNSTKTSNIRPLSLLCANNIHKNYHFYFSTYKKQRRDVWRVVNSNKCNKNDLDVCYQVIRDINKKIKWLDMIKTGKVTKEIIEEEYGKSEIFYLERHLQNTVSEDVLDLDSEMMDSINIFMNKC